MEVGEVRCSGTSNEWSSAAHEEYGLVAVTEDSKLGNHSSKNTSRCKGKEKKHLSGRGLATTRPSGQDCSLTHTGAGSRANPSRQLLCHRQAVDRAATMRRGQTVSPATLKNKDKNKPQMQVRNLLQIREKTP